MVAAISLRGGPRFAQCSMRERESGGRDPTLERRSVTPFGVDGPLKAFLAGDARHCLAWEAAASDVQSQTAGGCTETPTGRRARTQVR